MQGEGMGYRRDGGRIPVAVLGATGSVGQQFIALLDGHPWFEVTSVLASERSAGRAYGKAARWLQPGELPSAVAERVVGRVGEPLTEPLVFSALDSAVAGEAEARYAGAGHLVVSNARNHRMATGVPLLVPEVNPEHLELLSASGERIITNPNCSTIGLVMALKPLHDAFGVERVNVTTLQAVSGAGYPGVASLEILDNVVPFIPGEEEKLETEPRKILGILEGSRIQDARIQVSAQCNRVPVLDGHTECVSVSFSRPPSPEEAREALAAFRAPEEVRQLPSAPDRPVYLLPDGEVPQPRFHRDRDRGMRVTVGRVRACPLEHLRFVLVSHNTLRGAAGGALLCGELALVRGRVPDIGSGSVSGMGFDLGAESP